MIIRTASILCLFALAQAAVVQQRNIPVEVKYDEAASETINIDSDKKVLNEITESDTENNVVEETSTLVEEKTNAVRNLDEKIQLTPEELSFASKNLPLAEEISLKGLETLSAETTKGPEASNVQGILQQVEDIINSGLKKLKNSFKAEKDQKTPNPQQWEDFERAVNDYLIQEKAKLSLKQDQGTQPPQNQNIFQNIAQGFQTVANNFVQNWAGNGANENNTNQGDEQQGGQQGPFQGFVNFFQTSVGNVVSSINNLGNQGSTTSSTVLGDTGTATTQAPGFVSSFVNNVQQFFGQIQGAAQGAGVGSGGSSGTQGDTGTDSTATASPQRPGQIIQSIGSAINQFIQGRPPNTSGDEGTATTESNGNIIQSIGNVIQNSPLNPFRPSQKPTEGGATTANPIQAGISGVQNIGNQIQQLIPGQASSTEAPKIEDQVTVEQSSNQNVSEANNQIQTQQAKEVGLEVVDILPAIEQEESRQPEEIKAEELNEQMEEQVKQEEIKEELRQEEIRQEVVNEEKQIEEKKEILMTAD